MQLQEIESAFITPARLRAIVKAVELAGRQRVEFKGLSGSSAAMALAAIGPLPHPVVIMADTLDDAGYLYQDLSRLIGEQAVAMLPSAYKRDIKYGRVDPPSQIMRIETLNRLGDPADKALRAVVTYPEAIAEKVARKADLSAHTLRLAAGGGINLDDTRKWLIDNGFGQVDYVYEPGHFAIRGSIIDIFGYSSELPYRVDLFGDEIESIRTFNIETQLSERKLDSISVTANVATDSDSAGESLLDFVASDTLLCVRSEQFALGRIDAVCSETFSTSSMLADEGDANALKNLVDPGRFHARWETFSKIHFSGVKAPDAEISDEPQPQNSTAAPVAKLVTARGTATLDFGCTPQGLYHKNFDLISASFTHLLEQGYRLYILSDSEKQIERLRAIFAERGDKIPFTPVLSTLHEGFVDHAVRACFFTDHQIFDRFHKYTLKGERARSGKLALSLKELQSIEPGDFIVHVDHGVGRFGGLLRTQVNGSTQEMIKLVYKNNDCIFVSIHSLHKLAKYRGKEGVEPTVNKLGSGAWNRLKEKTKSKLKDIARDLIRLYAARKEEKGFSFSPDSYLQHELEASFIYEDTPDQTTATNAVKQDMESPRPMDRLICGDVGFGKTEIAVRAAFKAATDGKQVAVLVPTTLLVQQHYETFSERFEGFPVNVAAMSRFQTTKEINEAIEGLETGTVDVVIGTHKLLNPKIKFKDLGLVIIDEEQRFGVKHKETLKALRTNVDVLSLSATPIPRTLEMAVTGIREMSTLATPPEDRLPVLTYVGAYEDAQVTAAVRRELLRGGQVFYVHNRVQDISSIADKIHTLVPEAHVGIAHGKMGEKQLDQIIRDFWHRDIDVLVCTTIIETGLDISNANTLIVDHADRFGLSQLHQLRGRVGRGRERAYAYFLYDPSKPMTEQSHDRLATIAQNTALGSGFDVAMKDLELRGTGNLLGDEQSGHIEGVGFDLYVRMVSEAVEKYKEPEENVEPVAVSIDLPIEASIPIEYIDSDKLRLEAYRKLASARNEADLKDLEEELTDRYGKPPVEFETLFDVARLKFKARKLGISEILAQSNRVRIGRIDPPESIQMRMGRIYKGTQYRPVTHQLIVPTPFTGSLGQGPMSSDQVVLWTNQLLDDLAWTPSSSKRQSRL